MPRQGTLETPDWSFVGQSSYDLLGIAVDAVDWDGDGGPELVLSANGAQDNSGIIYMVDVPVW